MPDPTIREILDAWTDPKRQETHYAECWRQHPACALVAMARACADEAYYADHDASTVAVAFRISQQAGLNR